MPVEYMPPRINPVTGFPVYCPPFLADKAVQTSDATNSYLVGFVASLNDDTDLTIKLGYHTWRVHSKLMIANSPFFQAICNGKWKESKERIVELHNDDPWTFSRLLQFVYCNDYDGNGVGSRSSDMKKHLALEKLTSTGKADPHFAASERCGTYPNPLLTNFQLYELADKYGCKNLQDLARSNIARDGGTQEIQNLGDMIINRSMDDWKDLINKDEKLREIFAQKIATHYEGLKKQLRPNNFHKIFIAGEQSAPPDSWLGWLKEDNSFCLMVIDAMSKKA